MSARDLPGGPAPPLLRGWSHTVAASGAVVFTAALVQHASTGGLPLVTLLLYGLSSIWLFGCSAAYHLVAWSPTRREILRALDHGNIYVATAATWTAVGANVLDGWQRLVLLATVWVCALISVAVSLFHVRLSAVPRVGLCLLTGFSGVIAAPALVTALPLEAIGGSLAGASLYTIGGVVYAIRRPDPFPSVFGYHEVFHLLVIAGAAAFGAVIWIWVIPVAGR
jgi:hemolysin III